MLKERLQEIQNFLQKHQDDIFEEHIDYFRSAANYLQKHDVPKIKSKYGEHYIICPWSHDDVTYGPDTCSCFRVDTVLIGSKQLILRYEKLFKRNLEYKN